MSSPRVMATAAAIIDRILDEMPEAKIASDHEREAYLRGVIAGWKAAADNPGKG